MDYLVIGAGPAGVVSAEHLRKLDASGNIAIVGEETEPPYSRMAIPYYLVKKVGEEGTYLRHDPGHFEKHSIEVIQDRVTGVDPAAHSVDLASGGSRKYDRMIIATGARPVTPPIPGVDSPGVFSCWTLADARGIINGMQPGKEVVLIGAGFIGSIILEALAASGVGLTVIETENRMVPRMMSEIAGGLIKKWCEKNGIKVLTSTRVQSIEGGAGKGLTVNVDTGEPLSADMVISATGVTSNIEFLQGSGVEVKDGIVVDEFLASSAEHIYAAGDCAQGKDFSTGGFNVQAIQPTAVEHGRLAASNIVLGHAGTHPGQVNMNVLDTLGLISSSFGLWMGVDGGDGVERVDHDRFRYINLQFEDDCLIGASALGITDHIGVARGLIQTKVKLNGWKQKLKEDPTRLMEAYLANTQALG